MLRTKLVFLNRNKSCFPMSCRQNTVKAIFLSVLGYGEVTYRHEATSTLTPLSAVYHSALRFMS